MKQRIRAIRGCLNQGMIEREEVVSLALLAALSGEHLLLLGPPGTAKSILARKLHLAFTGGIYFERLLTKFSVPEELFGPLSIKALENDSYLRLTQRYLPSASIAFIDEIFKANSAILNALLTLLNEREFDNGDERVKVPLICVVAASNELPEEHGLAALYDRFLCRYQVAPVSAGRFAELLQLDDQPVNIDECHRFSLPQLSVIQQAAAELKLSDEVLQLLTRLREYLSEQQIYISDRRWRKAVKLLKIAAFTNGQSQVLVWDCYWLQHCLWQEPPQRQIIADWYLRHMGITAGFSLERLEKLTQTWEQVLQQERHERVQQCDERGRLLYTNRQGEKILEKTTQYRHLRDGKPLYVAPAGNDDRTNLGQGYDETQLRERFFDDVYQQTHINGQWVGYDQYVADPASLYVEEYENQPCMQDKRYSDAFIEGRRREIGDLADDIGLYQRHLAGQLDDLDDLIADHLWLTSAFSNLAVSSFDAMLQQSEQLSSRLHEVAEGYRQLPRLP